MVSSIEAVCSTLSWIGVVMISTGCAVPGRGVAAGSVSAGAKQAMSVICPTGDSTQRARTRMPVLISVGAATSTACSRLVSAPSSRISAQAKGRSNGWPSTGAPTHDHDTTVPSSATSTSSVSGCAVTGSYSAGGTYTRPSEPRAPTMRRSASPVMNAPSVGPSERV